MTTEFLSTMSDGDLLGATAQAARNERHATAELLTLLAEVDTRRLYLGEGCSSLFTYCTRVLNLSEHAAYHRIEAARAARQFPSVLSLLADGDVTLTTIAMLRPHLTPDNHDAVLSAARHKSKREVEQQIACLAPKPEAAVLIRRLPEVKAVPTSELPRQPTKPPAAPSTSLLGIAAATLAAPAAPRAKVVALSVDRYLLRVTLSADAHAKLRRAQDLMRHTTSNGDAAEIISHALTLLVDHLERTKMATTPRPRARMKRSRSVTRHIPAEVKREVWMRDGGRCAFVGAHGRCVETGRLEFHHLIPFAHGGAADIGNISLRCRAHNNFESEEIFGRWKSTASLARPTRSGPS